MNFYSGILFWLVLHLTVVLSSLVPRGYTNSTNVSVSEDNCGVVSAYSNSLITNVTSYGCSNYHSNLTDQLLTASTLFNDFNAPNYHSNSLNIVTNAKSFDILYTLQIFFNPSTQFYIIENTFYQENNTDNFLYLSYDYVDNVKILCHVFQETFFYLKASLNQILATDANGKTYSSVIYVPDCLNHSFCTINPNNFDLDNLYCISYAKDFSCSNLVANFNNQSNYCSKSFTNGLNEDERSSCGLATDSNLISTYSYESSSSSLFSILKFTKIKVISLLSLMFSILEFS
ncbi:uncharacterized protein ASCRUDRAFT_75219 [Ascoidea rubescens DSM 1968]|uniref:Uncharacterized protein n=1 Tax=Ascoidea rubescens DSM 1968 TaxID=1344418 RepID=A0A1D2VK48_9ASCO|nr:hypothetical protein ASCRUDRAFT_75219 [Ascoidea rubescens DSM 1968]ODV61978.1 hypothetical protein ASCRUDRAFT_75219 [Ascoidea rubescens DSM 1968]